MKSYWFLTMPSYKPDLYRLIEAALHSPGLMAPNEFNLARYSLHAQTRNQLLDPDVMALEDYLIDYSGLPEGSSNFQLLNAFGDVVHDICTSDITSLKIGYQYMAWLLAWLNTHHLPSFFGEDPDSPLQTLQMAAALGLGEWAAAYNQVEEGLERLFLLANSPLWRVRECSALGLERLMRWSWERTTRRLQYQCLIANIPEWHAILAAWRINPNSLLQGEARRQLDVLHLLQTGLHFMGELDAKHRNDPLCPALKTQFHHTLADVVRVNPALGFAQLGVWAHWDNTEVKEIIRLSLEDLGEWSEQVAHITACLDA